MVLFALPDEGRVVALFEGTLSAVSILGSAMLGGIEDGMPIVQITGSFIGAIHADGEKGFVSGNFLSKILVACQNM